MPAGAGAPFARRTAKVVFTTNALNLMHRATWSQYRAPARDEAGVPKGVGLHCLRHNGPSVKTMQRALGHATPTITLDPYVGEWPEETRAIVDGALGMCPQKAAGE
jgi:integrase